MSGLTSWMLDSLKCIAWKGRAIVVGFAAGQIEKLALNLVLLKNISIVGIHWGAYTSTCFPLPGQRGTCLTQFAEIEPERVPVVWKELLE